MPTMCLFLFFWGGGSDGRGLIKYSSVQSLQVDELQFFYTISIELQADLTIQKYNRFVYTKVESKTFNQNCNQ